MEFENSLAFATSLDSKDPLKEFRNRFIIPERNGEEQIYFLGNRKEKEIRSFVKQKHFRVISICLKPMFVTMD